MFINIAHASQDVVAVGDAAAAAAPTATSGFMSLIPMVLIFVIFYFMLIRPQLRKQKELSNMLGTLKVGDRVVAAGGIIGEIVKIEDDVIHISASKDNIIQVVKQSVTDKFEKKSDKKPEIKEISKPKKIDKKK